ncbi:putative oligopeptide transporter [Melampsora larici-populina 98AG31]|uniref:Putative oligopeptide transporter n=1 Tax=Melampsora larici-populina (strain 98AG31 / pathotype 3-4-7) TaxID=747676 RepID=F4RLY0_MELLP|nr:putative oligopeptide transporter [Melampsora larici-populina 98AG31]EGG06624.1 putative oligopeptide transporter [Melampsora larici-populina 98AG31]
MSQPFAFDNRPPVDKLLRQCSNASSYRAEDLMTPALPARPGGARRTDRPGLPSRPIMVKQPSRWTHGTGMGGRGMRMSPCSESFHILLPQQHFRRRSHQDPQSIQADDWSDKKIDPSRNEDDEELELKTKKEDSASGDSKPFDAGDDPTMRVITFRSVLVGFLLSIVAAAIAQLFQFKPVRVQISLLTLQILSFLLGTLLSKILPTRIRWLNPGPYTIKEDVFATLMAAASAYAAFGTEIFAPQILFFHASPPYALAVLAQFSNQILAICFAWLVRPFLVYPAECSYPAVIPSVVLFQSLHGGDPLAQRRIAYFKKFAPLIGAWEILPQFLAPALSAVNIFCMCLPGVPAVTNVFGGSSPNTGFGILSASLDWTNISAGVNGASPMYVPWVAQVNSWIALAFSIFLYLSLYKLRFLKSGAQDGYPFLSTELLDQHGGAYNRTAVFRPNGTLDKIGLETQGLPAFTLSFVISQAFAALLMTSAITQAIFQNWGLIQSMLFRSAGKTDIHSSDPHLKAMKMYRPIPMWFFLGLTCAATVTAYVCSIIAGTHLGIVPMISAMLLAVIIISSIGFLNATAGFNPIVAPACQMIGSVYGGSVIRSMWYVFQITRHIRPTVIMERYVVTLALVYRQSYFSKKLLRLDPLGVVRLIFTLFVLSLYSVKLMIYTKIPPWKGFGAQVVGTVIGVLVNQFVMQTIVTDNAAALVEPTASGQFSGIASQALFNEVSTWSLFAGQLYGPGRRYFLIPLSLLIGIFLPLPFLLVQRRYPDSMLGKFNVPLVAGTIQVAINGTTAGRTTAIVVGFLSQFYMRLYHWEWYKSYNHVLSAALDGGTQITVLLLSFAVGGGAGFTLNLPHYILNPAPPFLRDYCTRF